MEKCVGVDDITRTARAIPPKKRNNASKATFWFNCAF